jgi:hypothetical protein
MGTDGRSFGSRSAPEPGVPVGLGTDGVDGDVGAEVVGGLLHLDDDVVVLGEFVRLCVSEAPRLLQPILEVVDDDDPAGAHQPRGPGRDQTDRAGPEHDDRVALHDVPALRAEVPGGDGVGQQHGVLVRHPGRDKRGSNIGANRSRRWRRA